MRFNKLLSGVLFLGAISAFAASDRYLDGQHIRNGSTTVDVGSVAGTLITGAITSNNKVLVSSGGAAAESSISTTTLGYLDVQASILGSLQNIASGTVLTSGTGISVSGQQISLSTPVTLTNGGTSKALTAAAGGVVYTDADSMEVLAAGSSGQFLKSNGASAPSWDSFGAGSEVSWRGYADRIVGSSAQVSSGVASDSTIASALSNMTANSQIIILPGTYTENVLISGTVAIKGAGHGAVINGTVVFATGAKYSSMESVKVTGTITVNSGLDGIQIHNIWLSNGKTIQDNSGSGVNNYFQAIVE